MIKEKKAIYAGSFDPFTNGHLHIVKQACEVFDYLYIVLATNNDKKREYRTNIMCDAIEKTIINQGITNLKVVTTNGLISDLASEYGCSYLVRGLRNPNDFIYEENIAKINAELNPELKTVYFRANNEIISSSFVREMLKYKKDISKYVSKEVLAVIKTT